MLDMAHPYNQGVHGIISVRLYDLGGTDIVSLRPPAITVSFNP